AGKTMRTLTIDDAALVGTLRLRVNDSEVVVGTSVDDEVAARPDAMSYTAALACAQRLAGYRASDVDTSKPTEWSDLIGIGDVAFFAPEQCWTRRRPHDRLRVPIGITGWGGAAGGGGRKKKQKQQTRG